MSWNRDTEYMLMKVSVQTLQSSRESEEAYQGREEY